MNKETKYVINYLKNNKEVVTNYFKNLKNGETVSYSGLLEQSNDKAITTWTDKFTSTNVNRWEVTKFLMSCTTNPNYYGIIDTNIQATTEELESSSEDSTISYWGEFVSASEGNTDCDNHKKVRDFNFFAFLFPSPAAYLNGNHAAGLAYLIGSLLLSVNWYFVIGLIAGYFIPRPEEDKPNKVDVAFALMAQALVLVRFIYVIKTKIGG